MVDCQLFRGTEFTELSVCVVACIMMDFKLLACGFWIAAEQSQNTVKKPAPKFPALNYSYSKLKCI